MVQFDTVVVGGCVVTPVGETQVDLGINHGTIEAVESNLSGKGREEVVAEDCFVLPGIIDSHVHLNEPGNTDWEGFLTGSKAALAGGVTCLFDMPLNSLPTTTNVEAFEDKKKRGEANCRTDFALWGGLVPENIDSLESLYEAGVIAFKAFMANSGLAEFPWVDESALRKGMHTIARLPGMRLALHAEDEALTAKLSRQQKEIGDLSSTAFLNSRPIEAELLAIRMAIDIAGETGCPIHIVHVSCAEGISLISEAKQAGLDVTVETCPHYLSLTSDILESVGAIAKCAPPLRNTSTVEELREKVRTGEIDTIGSDHSPCPESLKTGSDFFKAWGGISSLQHATPITYSLLHKQLEMPLSSVAILTSQKPAQRFNLSEKGSLSVGMDADICIADFNNKEPVSKESLFYKNPHSPYLGTTSPFRVLRTLVRGQTVYNGGQFLDDFRGRFVRPNR